MFRSMGRRISAGRLFEFACCTILLGIAVALGWAAAGIGPSPFDPIGSGRIPLVLSVLLAVLALAVMVKSAASEEGPNDDGAGATEKPWRAIVVAALTIVFVATLSARSLPFVSVSAAYLLLVGVVLSLPHLQIGRGFRLLVVAIVLPSMLAYLFTHVLYIRLP